MPEATHSPAAAQKIGTFLTTNSVVSTLDFPSMTRWVRAYHPCDYRRVGRIMGGGKIEVFLYEGNDESNDSGSANAAYFESSRTGEKEDYWVINTTNVGGNVLNRRDLIVHEATHMIQDMKRLKQSVIEAEMDAYFAQALYHIRSKSEAAIDYDEAFLRAARAYEADNKVLRAKSFEKLRSECWNYAYWVASSRAKYGYGTKNLDKLKERSRRDGIKR